MQQHSITLKCHVEWEKVTKMLHEVYRMGADTQKNIPQNTKEYIHLVFN